MRGELEFSPRDSSAKCQKKGKRCTSQCRLITPTVIYRHCVAVYKRHVKTSNHPACCCRIPGRTGRFFNGMHPTGVVRCTSCADMLLFRSLRDGDLHSHRGRPGERKDLAGNIEPTEPEPLQQAWKRRDAMHFEVFDRKTAQTRRNPIAPSSVDTLLFASHKKSITSSTAYSSSPCASSSQPSSYASSPPSSHSAVSPPWLLVCL